MKKWPFRISASVLAIILLLTGLVLWSDTDTTFVSGRTDNKSLETVRPGWPGTPIDQKSRFINDEYPFLPKYRDLLKWTLRSNPFEDEKNRDTVRLEVRDPTAFLDSNADGILWLGHASVFVRLNGKSILLDPIFGTPMFVTRLVDVSSPLEKIRRLDYVLVSHNHRDHIDETTLRQIAQKFPNTVFLGGLGSEDVLNEWKNGYKSGSHRRMV